MKLREIPRIVLANSTVPLSAREIWSEAVRRGLDKQVGAKGKTPDATIGAFLCTQAKRPQSGIIAEGSKPARFRLVESTGQEKPHNEDSSAQTARIRHESKFLQPCLEVLKAHAPICNGGCRNHKRRPRPTPRITMVKSQWRGSRRIASNGGKRQRHLQSGELNST